VPYPGRTPHIHFAVKTRGREKFVTQCYIKGEPQNESDQVLRQLQDARAKATLMVPFTPIPTSKIGELAARFDIVLGFTPNV
jgi:protocatechuate 3,4-dioxygenase, beta subunit